MCIENSCRSQMAEALFNSMATNARAESAGTEPATQVDEMAVEAMKEMGIDISTKKPRMLTPAMNEQFDIIVTMGCIDGCPLTPKEKTIQWDIADPKGKGIEAYRRARDDIGERVKTLIAHLQ